MAAGKPAGLQGPGGATLELDQHVGDVVDVHLGDLAGPRRQRPPLEVGARRSNPALICIEGNRDLL
jgi:hypothetical protein